MKRICLSSLFLLLVVLFSFTPAGVYNGRSFGVMAGVSDNFVLSARNSSSVEKYVNLVNNSGFEAGLEGWNLRVGKGAEIDIDPSISFSGSQSLMIKRTDYGYGYVSQRFDIGNQTAKNFLVSGWAKSEEATEKYHFFDLLIIPVYEDGDSDWLHVEFSHGTHGWEYMSLAVSLNESKRVDYITLYVRFQDESGTVWFDDIRLIWVDANVQVKCVDESSVNLVGAGVRVYFGSEFLSEKNTDENGTVGFLLSANNDYSFVVYWKGIVVGREDYVEVLKDVELTFSCNVSFETKRVSLFLKDVLGQVLSNSEVEVHFRPLTISQDFLKERFISDSNGKVEFLVLVGAGEMRVLFPFHGVTYETSKILIVNSDMNLVLKFDFLKLGGFIVLVRDFLLYNIVLAFVGAGMIVTLRDVYKWRKMRRQVAV